MIDSLRKDMAREQIAAFFEKMRTMGYDTKETLELIRSSVKEDVQ
jgi:DNA-binding transcriptional regulator YhcF (GntR family)